MSGRAFVVVSFDRANAFGAGARDERKVVTTLHLQL